MSVRLNFVVEGQTEETFINSLLLPHLGSRAISCAVHMVTTQRMRGRKGRGGVTCYAQVKDDLVRWMKEDTCRDAFFTTMIDLYALPEDFPMFRDCRVLSDVHARVKCLEGAMGADVCDARFVPYIQLHEFETLLFSDLSKLKLQYRDRAKQVCQLAQSVAGLSTPEYIDDGMATAPSKRIIKAIPQYMKVSSGPIAAKAIGLCGIRAVCPHFDMWLTKLESLNK